jgi:hypothetical protein
VLNLLHAQPHAPSRNHMHYARVITNPHVNLKEPYNLNRADGNYVSFKDECVRAASKKLNDEIHIQTLCEQVILRALGRDSVPEFRPTRTRETYFPRTFTFKRARVHGELDRMIAAAKANGLPETSVQSLYVRGPEVIREHERRNGYDLPHGPGGVCESSKDTIGKAFSAERARELGLMT